MSSPFEQISSHILAEFDAGRLVVPSLPEVITRIRAAVNDEDKGTRQVARLIQLDPGLSARLVQIANSPSYRHSAVIDSCTMAVMRLGLHMTRNLVTCLVMHNIFNIESDRLRQRVRELWQHSCHVAAISFVLAQLHKGQLEAEKALLAGLVHDIGVLPVLHYAMDFPDILAGETELDMVIGHLRGPLGRRILEQWHFSPELTVVPEQAELWSRDEPGALDYVDLVIVAQAHSYFGSGQNHPVPSLLDLAAFKKMTLSRLGPDASVELLHEAREEIRKMVSILLN